jgi:hypothetical protein
LIVGLDGWPLQKDGRLTNKLRKARALQRAGRCVGIWSEDDLLARLGLHSQADSICRRYTVAEVSTLLKVPGDQLRKWIKAGVIHPAETVEGVSRFDYGQVVGARTLCSLMQAGVKPARLKRSLRQLAGWLENVQDSLPQLEVLKHHGDLLVRLEDGLAEPSGQRCFDFREDQEQPSTVTLPASSSGAEAWIENAAKHEEREEWVEAVEAYRQALLLGARSGLLYFNLANTLAALGHKEQALERYYQAVECQSDFAEAWNNAGVVLTDLGRPAEAKVAFQCALQAESAYADAHYNLADLLDEQGETAEARKHWQAYLRHDQHTEWAEYAHRRLTSG